MLLESPERAEGTYPPEDSEERRALVKRIIASASFARSNRLSEFLKFVCALAEKGRLDDINEQNIGSAVFGRTRGYDPGVDSIVRSHASRLRHRLKDYFEQEGHHETLILTIPRGSYIPFYKLRATENVSPLPDLVEELSEAGRAIATVSTSPVLDPAAHRVEQVSASRKTIERLQIALVAAGVLVIVLVLFLILHASPRVQPQNELTTRNPLWKQLLAGPAAKTVVVSSDSGLVMYEHLTGNSVSLTSYLSGEYLKHTTSGTVSEEIVRKFGTRRYTPALDLTVLDRMTRLFSDRQDRLSFHYARDLRIEDLKQGNAILLGTSESNPWVQLFEPSMTFFFQDDLLHDTAKIVNRHPLAGEALHYDSTPHDAAPTIYGIVAYRPNLQRSGHVLILEGQTMAGTQTAADFVFDDSHFLPFLNKIKGADGTIPYFELLLRSSSFGGQSSRIEMVAFRVETD